MSAAMSIRQHWSQRRPRLILQGWQTLQLLKLCFWHLRYWSYRGVMISSVRQSLIYCHCYTVSVGCNVSQSSCYWNHITFFSKTVVCTKFSNYTVKDQNPTQTRVNVNSLIRLSKTQCAPDVTSLENWEGCVRKGVQYKIFVTSNKNSKRCFGGRTPVY